jgi:hypothetical protein
MRRDALIDGHYRYWLLRDWSGIGVNRALGPLPERFGVLWVMLNPSTADHQLDDPTIRKCIGFTKRLGFESFAVVNLFALRSSDPGLLRTTAALGEDIVGPKNDETIAKLASQAALIICAWGAYDGLGPHIDLRIREVTKLLESWRTCSTCNGTMSRPVYAGLNDTFIGAKACPACLDHHGEERCPTRALGFTKSGEPRHPLMMPYYAASELKAWPAGSKATGSHTPRPEGLTAGADAQLRTSTHPEEASADGDGGAR